MLLDLIRFVDIPQTIQLLDDLEVYQHIAEINGGLDWVMLGASESPVRWFVGQPGLPI